jgi:hypothetical protein
MNKTMPPIHAATVPHVLHSLLVAFSTPPSNTSEIETCEWVSNEAEQASGNNPVKRLVPENEKTKASPDAKTPS